MKLIKLSIIAFVLACSARVASAQVHIGVGVNIGVPVRRVIVAPSYPVYETYPRTVYYERPVYRRYPRRVIYRQTYYGRPHYRNVHYRHVRRVHGHGPGRRHW